MLPWTGEPTPFVSDASCCEAKKISVIISSLHGPESLERCVENCGQQNELSELRDRDRSSGRARQKSLSARHRFPGAVFRQMRRMIPQRKNYAVAQTDSPWLLFLDDCVEADRAGLAHNHG